MTSDDRKAIMACPKCGSLEIGTPYVQEGGIPGISEVAGTYYCENCKSKILPVIFNNKKEYKKFIESGHKFIAPQPMTSTTIETGEKGTTYYVVPFAPLLPFYILSITGIILIFLISYTVFPPNIYGIWGITLLLLLYSIIVLFTIGNYTRSFLTKWIPENVRCYICNGKILSCKSLVEKRFGIYFPTSVFELQCKDCGRKSQFRYLLNSLRLETESKK